MRRNLSPVDGIPQLPFFVTNQPSFVTNQRVRGGTHLFDCWTWTYSRYSRRRSKYLKVVIDEALVGEIMFASSCAKLELFSWLHTWLTRARVRIRARTRARARAKLFSWLHMYVCMYVH